MLTHWTWTGTSCSTSGPKDDLPSEIFTHVDRRDELDIVDPMKISTSGSARVILSTGTENHMERILALHIEKLPEGVYLATSDEVQGLVAQGRTIAETIEIARDVAIKILAARAERSEPTDLRPAGESFDYPLIVNA